MTPAPFSGTARPRATLSLKRIARVAFAAVAAACAVFNCSHVSGGAAAFGGSASTTGGDAIAPDPRRGDALRVLIFLRAARAVTFETPVASVTVVNPEFVTAQVSGERTVVFTGVAIGEAMVIVKGADGTHRALVVEVRGRPGPTPAERAARAARTRRERGRFYGTSTLLFSPAFGGGPSLLRQSADITARLSERRTLHASVDLFRFAGGGRRALSQPVNNLGLDRLQLGIDSPSARLDLFDSVLNVSPLSLNGYAMRGAHWAAADATRLRGAEFFAGAARPTLTLFDNSEGYLAGAVLPVASAGRWRLRAGAFAILPRRSLSSPRESQAGFVWHADWHYAARAATAEGEADYARGSASWRARADVRRAPLDLYAEALRADYRSPLAAVGAQPGGRRLTALALTWRPLRRVSANVSYQSASNRFVSAARAASLNASSLFAGVHFQFARNSRASLRYSARGIETGAGAASSLTLDTRDFAATYSTRLGRRWSNEFEAALTSSRERAVGSRLARGLSVREELSLKSDGWSAAGFFNYQGDAPSLAGLIVRNPQLLPAALRAAYEADPARFLLTNRDTLGSLLPGVQVPESRSSSVGARLQAEVARVRFTGEARYGAGEILARGRRELLTTFGASLRLDAANTLNLSGSHPFASVGARSPTALTVSLVHRFGAGGGFGPARLLGFDRGAVEGRVFFDLNADGNGDAGEPGAAGVLVRLDGGRAATTDAAGRFRFAGVGPGAHEVALASDRLGVSLRASTPATQSVEVAARRTARLGFGLTNFGSVGGRVFNDLLLTGGKPGAGAPGVGGVRLILRPAAASAAARTWTTDASGLYEFRDLTPGDYTLELDPASLPPDFRVPPASAWPLKVSPLQGTLLDLPLAAQRAVAGVVFIDRDGDGRFDPSRDLPLAGVRVTAGDAETLTSQDGTYLLRNLPAGKVRLRAYRAGNDYRETVIDLPDAPTTKGAVDIDVTPTKAEKAKTML